MRIYYTLSCTYDVCEDIISIKTNVLKNYDKKMDYSINKIAIVVVSGHTNYYE